LLYFIENYKTILKIINKAYKNKEKKTLEELKNHDMTMLELTLIVDFYNLSIRRFIYFLIKKNILKRFGSNKTCH